MKPLDVTTMGHGEDFPGTIWIAGVRDRQDLRDGAERLRRRWRGGGCVGHEQPRSRRGRRRLRQRRRDRQRHEPLLRRVGAAATTTATARPTSTTPTTTTTAPPTARTPSRSIARDGTTHQAAGRDLVGERLLTRRRHRQHGVHGAHDERIGRLPEPVRRVEHGRGRCGGRAHDRTGARRRRATAPQLPAVRIPARREPAEVGQVHGRRRASWGRSTASTRAAASRWAWCSAAAPSPAT